MTSYSITLSDGLVPDLSTQQAFASEKPHPPPVEAASRIIAQQYPILDAASLDKAVFTIRIRTTRKLRRDLEAFARKTNLPLRSFKRFRAKGYDSVACGFIIKLLTYGGLKLTIFPPDADGLSDVKVEMNPAKILYGHNGRMPTYEELLDAFCIYITHARNLLEDQDDWIDLIPGLRAGGPGCWKLLELPYHCSDPDGSILAALRHLHHPAIRTQARHWPTSIELGSKRANLQFSIYRKAIEMMARGKLPANLLPLYSDILRLEVRLRGKKLLHYLGNDDTVEVVEGKERLVRFYPDPITQARRTAFEELENVWHSDEVLELSKQLGALGALIAQVASDPRCVHSFPELVRHLAFYSRVGSKRDTMRTIRSAGAGVMSLRSTLSFDSLFSDDAQPSIAIPEIERKVSHRLEDIRRDPLLEAAYLPPGYVSHRSNPFPSYCS